MMKAVSCDYAVIGSGPAGQKAAMQASKLGKRVVVIEKERYPGGASLNWGTLPSKTLREAILDLTDFYKRSFYGLKASRREISINDLNYRLNFVLQEERNLLLRQFQKNHIELIYGTAHFMDPYQLAVIGYDGKVNYQVKAKHILIATGSKPRNPLHVPFDKDVILDSTSLLQIDHLPKTLLVLGGGVIGSEYASFFAALGTEVKVIDKRDHLLPNLDSEIGLHLQKSLGHLGLEVIGGKTPQEIRREGKKAIVKLNDGQELRADMLLYALGREASVADLKLENAGLQKDAQGYISVNPFFQTDIPHIYAAGDVIGGPCLASTSMEQGRLAARHAFGAQSGMFPHFYPIGIYTIPEISSCGKTEEQLVQLGIQYKVGRAYYYEIARNIIRGNDSGLFKILFDAETLEILGIHIIGRAATEVIHIGQIAMSFNARIDYFIDQVFNYPTYAEGYRIAALNGINKLSEMNRNRR
jgi:NAD(P) transhydrogenase